MVQLVIALELKDHLVITLSILVSLEDTTLIFKPPWKCQLEEEIRQRQSIKDGC